MQVGKPLRTTLIVMIKLFGPPRSCQVSILLKALIRVGVSFQVRIYICSPTNWSQRDLPLRKFTELRVFQTAYHLRPREGEGWFFSNGGNDIGCGKTTWEDFRRTCLNLRAIPMVENLNRRNWGLGTLQPKLWWVAVAWRSIEVSLFHKRRKQNKNFCLCEFNLDNLINRTHNVQCPKG